VFRPFSPSTGNKIRDWQLRADVVGRNMDIIIIIIIITIKQEK
jgi:hypothetical protein